MSQPIKHHNRDDEVPFTRHLVARVTSAQRIADVNFWVGFTATVAAVFAGASTGTIVALAAATAGFLAIAATLYDPHR